MNLIIRRTLSKALASEKRTPEDKRHHTYPHQDAYKNEEENGMKTAQSTKVTTKGVPHYALSCDDVRISVENKATRRF